MKNYTWIQSVAFFGQAILDFFWKYTIYHLDIAEFFGVAYVKKTLKTYVLANLKFGY